jgi:hypothetical protein
MDNLQSKAASRYMFRYSYTSFELRLTSLVFCRNSCKVMDPRTGEYRDPEQPQPRDSAKDPEPAPISKPIKMKDPKYDTNVQSAVKIG